MEPARIRVLCTAFAAVPGSSPHSAAMLAMVASVRAEIDLISVKTESQPHVDRLGDARMFRVPVGDAAPLEQRVMFDRAVARQLDAERYDVVHVTGPFEGALAAERKPTLGFTFVYEMATFPDEALGAEVERRWSEAHEKCLSEADLVIVPTESAKRAVSDVIPERRVVVVPPGVDVGAFDWRPTAEPNEPRLLYLGTFTADRDIATMLGAVRRVRSTRPVLLLMAGETDRGRRQRLRAMIEAFELKGAVEVRGEPPPQALPQIIAAADLCLAPASEVPRFQALGDLPQPLLEYLACQRPVVAAGVPGVAEVLRDEQEGLLYPPGDEQAFADAILEMLRDGGLKGRTIELGYKRVRELFSSGARRRRMADVYERLTPGSQITDPWEESFPDGWTGQHAMVDPTEGDHAEADAEPSDADAEAMARAADEILALDAGSLPPPDAEVLRTGDFAALDLDTSAGRTVAPRDPPTSELDAVEELEGEATQGKTEAPQPRGLVPRPPAKTDPNALPPERTSPHANDTDPGSRPP